MESAAQFCDGVAEFGVLPRITTFEAALFRFPAVELEDLEVGFLGCKAGSGHKNSKEWLGKRMSQEARAPATRLESVSLRLENLQE